jgi:uncharacterized membrane protein
LTLATITTYQVYLAIHILAAVIWVGGGAAVHVFAVRTAKAKSVERLAGFSADADWIGTRVFVPASLLLVVFGFLLVHEGNWDYKFWVVFPIVVWVASFVVGAGFLGPESKRLHTALERDRSVESAEVVQRVGRLMMVSRVELGFLVLVVLDMTLKPFS